MKGLIFIILVGLSIYRMIRRGQDAATTPSPRQNRPARHTVENSTLAERAIPDEYNYSDEPLDYAQTIDDEDENEMINEETERDNTFNRPEYIDPNTGAINIHQMFEQMKHAVDEAQRNVTNVKQMLQERQRQEKTAREQQPMVEEEGKRTLTDVPAPDNAPILTETESSYDFDLRQAVIYNAILNRPS